MKDKMSNFGIWCNSKNKQPACDESIAQVISQVSSFQDITLTTNQNLPAPSNLGAGVTHAWIIRQDGVGGHTLTYDPQFRFSFGIIPVLSAAGGAVDVLTGVSDGSVVYVNLLNDFQ